VAARAPLLLMATQLMVAVAPWNLPLWWQLRRFRFVVEVDCDRRVLKKGLDPVTYGEALLAVGQNSRYPAIVVGALLALCSAFMVSAAQLEAPVKMAATPDLRKPPPTDEGSLGRKFEVIVRERYPQLLSETVAGVPVVNLLFKGD